MKKTIIAFILIATIILTASVTSAHAYTVEEARSIQLQADSLIAAIDENSLILDAMENVIDTSVPLSIRESIIASADFSPAVGVAQDAIELEVNSTVQKVGEINLKSGETANMYVAATVAEIKEDYGSSSLGGVSAVAYVYWIDNPGTENELVAAAGSWNNPNSRELSNRKVRYGVADPLLIAFIKASPYKYPTTNYAYYSASGFIGLTLCCMTWVDIEDYGTLHAKVGSSILT